MTRVAALSVRILTIGAKEPRSQTTGPISKFQTPFDSPVRELPVQGQKFDPEVTDDVTGQVKVRIFDFSGLVITAACSAAK